MSFIEAKPETLYRSEGGVYYAKVSANEAARDPCVLRLQVTTSKGRTRFVFGKPVGVEGTPND